jgi:REP element-mobilizing transposase RayT
MSHSYVRTLTHVIFSTKERQPQITSDLQERLFPYLNGIARENGFEALAVGGMPDHVHLVLQTPSTMAIAKAVQLVKGASSKWVHDTFPHHAGFAWQEGYGAFSIGASQLARTVAYVRNQAEHHRTRTFQEEYLQFLESNGVEYDPRYVWG